MDKVIYNVSGLVNSQSRTEIRNSLDKIKGVKEVAIDMGRGTVEVEFNIPATGDKIREKIEHIGYPIK